MKPEEMKMLKETYPKPTTRGELTAAIRLLLIVGLIILYAAGTAYLISLLPYAEHHALPLVVVLWVLSYAGFTARQKARAWRAMVSEHKYQYALRDMRKSDDYIAASHTPIADYLTRIKARELNVFETGAPIQELHRRIAAIELMNKNRENKNG